MVGNAEGKVRTVDNFVPLFYAVGVGGRVDFFMIETKTVVKTDGRWDERERCSEQERVGISDRDFLLVLSDLRPGREFVEVSDEVLVLGICLGTETVYLFVEESVAGFSRDAFRNV